MAVALTVLLPFEVVGKLSLLVAAFLFVANPFVLARVVALTTVIVILLLSRLRRTWLDGQSEDTSRTEPSRSQ